MDNGLFQYLLVNISLLVLVAAILIEVKPLRRLLKKQKKSLPEQLCLGLIFGLLSISGTYTGLSLQGAVVNTRVVSTLAAGLVGGPLPGLCAGLMGGVHRLLYDPDGFTSLACAIGTFCFGVIGGLACRRLPQKKGRNPALILLVIFSELLQSLIILAISRPFSAALELEKVILLPKIVMNSLGLVLFMSLLDRFNRSVTIELAEQQYLALLIAHKCLPFLRDGLENREAMRQAADMVREMLPECRVALTNREEVVAASGMELSSVPLPARKAMDSGELVMERDASDLCGPPHHRNRAFIAAPLTCGEERIGALLFCVPQGPNLILEADCRTAEGLARLFSSMLEVGELQHQIQMRQQAELRALQSQIDPHFLFNSLSTVSALCTANPKKAKEMILVLANYFRQALSINEPFVTLEQELSNVGNFLTLVEARFEDALCVEWDLPEPLPVAYLPPLILQPVVENAVRHGGTSVDDRYVYIRSQQRGERVQIQVSDHGHGFPPEILERLQNPRDCGYTGLFNVQKRLRSVYGGQCGFSGDSSEKGSTVAFSIPVIPPGGLRPGAERSADDAYRSH